MIKEFEGEKHPISCQCDKKMQRVKTPSVGRWRNERSQKGDNNKKKREAV